MSRTDGNEPEIEHDNEAAVNAAATGQSAESAGTTPQSEPTSSNESESSRQPWYKRIRWWGWLLITIAAVIIGFFGTFGTQAYMAYRHEMAAVDAVTNTVKSGNMKDLPKAVQLMQQETKKANEITHNGLWKFTGKIRGLRSNIRAAQELTQIVEDTSADVVPKYMDIASSVSKSKLLEHGRINVMPLVEQYADLVRANDGLKSQLAKIQEIHDPSLPPVRKAIQRIKGLGSMADYWVGQSEVLVKNLPTFLGYEGKQTYAILAMTPSEMRMSGGLIGAIGTLTFENGAFTIGEFKSNPEYVNGIGSAEVGADSHRIFMNEGPLYMSYDVRDVANFPNTQLTAEAFNSIWKRTEWGAHTELSGVILADPVIVQALVGATGDITMPDGRVLTGSNTAEFLMNTVYKDYEPEETDQYFGIVTKECIGKLMANMNMKTIGKLAMKMQKLATQRHLSVYSFNPVLENFLMESGLTAQYSTDKTKPQVGIFLTEQNPSKLGWYLKRSTKITQICTDEAPDKYHVEYTIHNNLTEREASEFATYIKGQLPYNEGAGVEKILFYPPYGGELSNFKVEGTGSVPSMDTFEFAVMYRSLAQVKPEQSVTYSFDVTTSKQATNRLTVDQTPMGTENTNVEYLNSCPVN